MWVIADYCHPNTDPTVPCLFCDADRGDPQRHPTPWRTSDGYAVCDEHAADYAQTCYEEDNP